MDSSDEWRTGRHVLFNLNTHLVFVTKYRRPAITDRVSTIIEQACRDVCAEFEATLDAYEHDGDHVHLLISYPPKIAVSRLVNSLKGVSARRVRQAGYPEVQQALWGDHFWSPSYCAISAGGAPLETIKKYIEGQRSPNRKAGRPRNH